MTAFSILKWQRAVMEHLAETRPANHSSIAALVPVLVIHARADGSRCHPSQELMALQAGLTRNTVRRAIDQLVGDGFMEHVQNRARGLREYKLQMSNRHTSSQLDVYSPSESDAQSDAQSDAHLETTNYGNSVTPLDPLTQERAEVCLNCERSDGHDFDCAHRPFEAVTS